MSGTVVFTDDSCVNATYDTQNHITEGFTLLREQLVSAQFLECVKDTFMGTPRWGQLPELFPEVIMSKMQTVQDTIVDCPDYGHEKFADAPYFSDEMVHFSRWWVTPSGPEGVAATGAHEVSHNYGYQHLDAKLSINYQQSVPVTLEACSGQWNGNPRPLWQPARSFLRRETVLADVGFYGGIPFDMTCGMDAMLDGLNVTEDGVHVTSLATSCQSLSGKPGWWNTVYPPVGMEIGTPWADRCPAGKIPVGLRGSVSNFLSSVGLICVERLGWSAEHEEADTSVIVARNSPSYLPERGNAFGPYHWERLCPGGMALKGIRGRQWNRVDQLELNCQRVDRNGDIRRLWLTKAGTASATALSDLELCAGYSVMSGLYLAEGGLGTAAAHLNRLGGYCETVIRAPAPALVRQPTYNGYDQGPQYLEAHGNEVNAPKNAASPVHDDFCAADQALVGLQFSMDTTVKGISGLCANVAGWSTTPASTPLVNLPWRGSTAGTLQEAKCADGDFLNGWYIESSAAGVETVTVICRTFQMDPPPMPTGMAAVQISQSAPLQVQLTWTATEDATSYIVQRSTNALGPYSQIGTADVSATFVDATATHGVLYYWLVIPANAAGMGRASAPVGLMPIMTPPATPTNLQATVGNAIVTLSWDAVAGATSYTLRRHDGTTLGDLVTTGETNYVDTAVINGHTYLYWVLASNDGGSSALSLVAEATPMAPPSPPVALNVVSNNNTAQLTWTAVPGATSYMVYRSTTSPTSGFDAGHSVTTTSYTDSNLVNGATYYYAVAAVSASGIGEKSQAVSACEPIDLGAEHLVSGVANNACLKVTKYPSWSPYMHSLIIQPQATGTGWPIPFTWKNCSTTGASSLPGPWQQGTVRPTSGTCPTIIKLGGNGAGSVSLTWWANG